MSRMRSPSYPAISIDQAIDLVARIHRSCRANVIDRETAAREMGYSGLTGRSMKVLADLIQFHLLQKAGKGDVKVSQLAVDILHGIDPQDREQARLEAALAPQLFRDIHERFPDGIPSENAIRSYLIQQDFMDAAISPAITAFMETYRAVEDIRESESHRQDAAEAAHEAETVAVKPDDAFMEQLAKTAEAPSYVGRTLPAQPQIIGRRELVPNEPYLDIRGSREVHIEGIFDLNGVEELEEKLKALKMLLKRPEKPKLAAEFLDQVEEAIKSE